MDTDIQNSCLVGWCMYCVTLRLHDIKKLTSVSLEYTMEVHLAYAYILPFWWKSSLHLSIIVWVAIYIYFLLYILLSQNWQQDQFQYLSYQKKFISSSRNISVTKKSSICRKYTHKIICIDITQLTASYCYSATNSITNLSNK